MTYLPTILVKSKNPKIAMLRVSCSDDPLTTSSLCTFDLPTNFGFNNIPSSAMSYSGNTITLNKGHWQLQGFVAIENNDDRDNNAHFQFKETNFVGTRGCSEIDYNSSLDDCAYNTSIENGSIDITLGFPIINYSGTGSLTVQNSYAHIIIYYCAID